MRYNEYRLNFKVNGHEIRTIRIGQHYQAKHGSYLNDEFILDLVLGLDEGHFPVDSTSSGLDYYAADLVHETDGGLKRTFRVIWIFEGDVFEILGVVNAYRRKSKKGKKR
jgi:hypothetical protein